MIVTVEKFREYVDTTLTDSQIEEKLSALESLIRARTNNNFQKRNRRSVGNIIGENLVVESPIFKAGDTIEISESEYNNGLYNIQEIDNEGNITLKEHEDLISESGVLVTKVYYPLDVRMGIIEVLKWQLKNELQNGGGTENKPVQSETLSRHSVSYAQDSTESDIDLTLGVPRKLTSFFTPYIKARF